jgi:hypothetical protein
MLIRGPALYEKMSDYLVREVRAASNIRVRLNTRVVDGGGTPRLEHLTLHDDVTAGIETVPAGALFVLIGATTHTEWLDRILVRDRHGFVITGTDLPRRRPATGPPIGRRCNWKPANPACSPPATHATAPSTESPPRSVRAPPRCNWSTSTSQIATLPKHRPYMLVPDCPRRGRKRLAVTRLRRTNAWRGRRGPGRDGQPKPSLYGASGEGRCVREVGDRPMSDGPVRTD